MAWQILVAQPEGVVRGLWRMDRARADAGRALRKVVPRSAHAAWAPGAGRSPLALLEAFDRHRVPELLPIRTARMRASPFAF
jgi:hypothetical protein